jgi:sodium/potassium-transporting ATPase subunit alpha
MKLKLPKLFKRGKKNQTSPKEAIDTSVNETFHKLELNDLVRQLNTSATDGLTSVTAAQVLAKNGKNLIKQKSENPVLKIIKYFLSGFCPLIWVAAIICILAWQPLGSIGGDQPQIINLGLGVLLIIVILLQAAFTAFQDWSSGKVMKSIKVRTRI